MKSAIIFKNITLEVNLFATSENSCTKFSTHQVPDRDRIECSHTEKKTPKWLRKMGIFYIQSR